MDSICAALDLPRQYQIPAATIAMITTATAATPYFRAGGTWTVADDMAAPDGTLAEIADPCCTVDEDEDAAAIGPDPEGATGEVLATELLPESISRFSP